MVAVMTIVSRVMMIKLNFDRLTSASSPYIESWENVDKMQFELTIPERNNEFRLKFLKHSKKIELLGKDAYISILPGVNVLCLIEDGKVTFLLQYEEHSRTGNDTYIVQKVVWQDPIYNKGFARKLMLYCLDHYSYIETSEAQFPRGVLMWKKFIVDNIGSIYVYVYDKNSIVRIKNLQHFEDWYKKCGVIIMNTYQKK